jgi:hypothetical protein
LKEQSHIPHSQSWHNLKKLTLDGHGSPQQSRLMAAKISSSQDGYQCW